MRIRRKKSFSSDIKKVRSINFTECDQIKREWGKYTIDAKKPFTQEITLPETLTNNEIMFVSFNVNNDIKGGRKDAWVSINGNKNKLTALIGSITIITDVLNMS